MKFDVKTTIIISLIIAIIVLSTCNSCKETSYQKKIAKLEQDCKAGSIVTKSDTVYMHDTMRAIIERPVPYEVTNGNGFTITPIENDTIYLESYADTCNDYFTQRKYRDTTKTQYGNIITEETVSQNKLQSKTVRPFFSIPTITNTITETKIEQRAILYLGIDGYGDRYGLNGAGVSLFLKTKKSLGYEIGTYFNQHNSINFRGSIKIPLSLKK